MVTTVTMKTTEDAIKFFELLRAGCNQRRIAWWLNDALNELPSTEATPSTKPCASTYLWSRIRTSHWRPKAASAST